ncbi:MAG TPA: PD-(D/E)XK nuclease family protein [Gammaproteobacteria bacterium]|nr:PD-(D/E)XK nuclease family protein [Gammaproteobacteria bacterium]
MRHELLANQLPDFFEAWLKGSTDIALKDKLSLFFEVLKDLLPPRQDKVVNHAVGKDLDTVALKQFLEDLAEPIRVVKESGHFCDPWAVASLRRHEVRNAGVFAWLLNIRGTHGLGDKVLRQLLRQIRATLPLGFPTVPSRSCAVRTESCPDGDEKNRVDIEIEDTKFLLIIEVKIDAPEGSGQLNRYCRISHAKSHGRPWAVAYLTPTGRASASTLEWPEHVLRLSWKQCAFALTQALRERRADQRGVGSENADFVDFLVTKFCRHIRCF